MINPCGFSLWHKFRKIKSMWFAVTLPVIAPRPQQGPAPFFGNLWCTPISHTVMMHHRCWVLTAVWNTLFFHFRHTLSSWYPMSILNRKALTLCEEWKSEAREAELAHLSWPWSWWFQFTSYVCSTQSHLWLKMLKTYNYKVIHPVSGKTFLLCVLLLTESVLR